MKKRKMLLTVILATAVCFPGCGVKQTEDTVTVEAGQELELKATDFFRIREEKAKEFVFDLSEVNLSKTGIYEVLASYKKNTYTINVVVEDTTPPEVLLKERYVFTNDAVSLDAEELIEGVYDAGRYTASLIRFEKIGNLEVLDAAALKALTDEIPVPGEKERLAALGSTKIPEEEGIYRAVMSVTDECGNATLEEICLILDKTGARIADQEDRIIETGAGEMDQMPEADPSDYHVFDNADGVIPPELISCEVKRKDVEAHSYVVHVSYRDRAGNESSAEFLMIVQEEQSQEEGEQQSKEGKERPKEERKQQEEEEEQQKEERGVNEVRIENQNEEDAYNELTPVQQSAADAGYGVIVRTETGYAVMVHGGEDGQILEEFLTSIGCRATRFGGSWICAANDQYLWVASGIVPLITEDDPEFWD